MRIVMLPSPEGDVVARENQFGHLEGEFFVGANRQVFYRYESESQVFFVNRNLDEYGGAVGAFNRYNEDVARQPAEEDQLYVVERFRGELKAVGVDMDSHEDYWPLILEQAENGML